MAEKELFGNSEQLEKDHFADPGNMVGDTISRQAAITLFEKYGATEDAIALLESLPSAQPTDEDIQRMQDIEQAMLEKAYWFGNQDAQEWISCSERLPRAFETVNVTVQIPEGRYVKESALVNGIWEGINEYAKVVAWMPLPKPWKGEQE